MYVKNQEYLHLHDPRFHQDKWKVGNTLNFTNRELNNFNAYYENYSPKIDIDNRLFTPMDGLKYVLDHNIHVISQKNADSIVRNAKDIINELAIYMREQIFEEIREKYFPELPSRKTCIWIFEKHAATYWANSLGSKTEIYKLQLTGIMHKADQIHLKADIFPHEELKRRAFNYWTGTDGKNPIEEELLFEGIVFIKEKYTDINDMLLKE